MLASLPCCLPVYFWTRPMTVNFMLRLYIPPSGLSNSWWQLKPPFLGATTHCSLFSLLWQTGHISSFFPMTAIQIFEDNQILRGCKYYQAQWLCPLWGRFEFCHHFVPNTPKLASISLYMWCPTVSTVSLVWRPLTPWSYKPYFY